MAAVTGPLPTFLLEIGTEELPADFARLALPQLESLVQRDLAAARLSHGPVVCTSTPRRLALLVPDLPNSQDDQAEERKGPPASAAFQDGVPTPAAQGFASRCGVDASQLEVRETPKGPFVFAVVHQAGQPTAEVLAELIPQWITTLQGRRFMRWGHGESRFSRPVRWLVALLDGAVVPVQLMDSDPPVSSGNRSRGHRLRDQAVEIANAQSYAQALATAGVEVHREDRRAWIHQQVQQAATGLGAKPDCPESLLDELTDLVESPVLIQGDVDPHYLSLPAEVLSTVMRSHQRYVPLVREGARIDPLALDATESLLPSFLCIGNGLPAASATVKRGNERVLRARLADAEFFVQADRAVASIDRRSQLARVTFAEGLGSLLDRVERLEWLTDVLLEAIALPDPTADHARRAAHLCKHDLVSQMVGEFPELQGVIGGKYLLAEGEPRAVSLAVLEHYLPKGAGDALPSSEAGAVVALAERFELLLSIYAKGERPSGSSDPYALRRSGNGIVQILKDQGWHFDLVGFLVRATTHWSQLLPHCQVDAAALAAELAEFLRQRLVNQIEEDGIDADLVQAVAGDPAAAARVLEDPADVSLRAALLVDLRRRGELPAVQAVVTRAARLAEKADLAPGVVSAKGVVDPALFEQPSEAAMLEVLNALEPMALAPSADTYGALAQGLSASAEALAAFFDGDQSVMVMVDQPAIRANRLNLLAILRNQAYVLADFSRISG